MSSPSMTNARHSDGVQHAQAEELARSNADLERFAYVASHELQEPLRMIGNYTRLLVKRYRGKFDTDADEFMGYTVDAVDRMQRLIDDLLNFSRVASRAHEPRTTDAGAAVARTLRDLQPAIDESGAEIDVGELPTVLVEGGQLATVLQNLICNAIKFRGALRPTIQICAEPKGEEWLFSVSDNGIGIETTNPERVFGLFQRLNARDKYPGSGIGLALCKMIVERHGGRIWYESEPGFGTTFYFTLPAAAAAPPTTSAGGNHHDRQAG